LCDIIEHQHTDSEVFICLFVCAFIVQLVRLLPARAENGDAVEILEEFANIGPIVDLCVVNIDNQSQVSSMIHF
jgi:hypothetical protein